MNYYQVEAKCGHVGRNNYILKKFYICACNAKEAATIVRYMGRVKHHHKDAIRNVLEIEYEEYLDGVETNNNDPYFKVDNPVDQRLLCEFNDEEIYKEKEKIIYKKKTHARRHFTELLMLKEWELERNFLYE